MRVCVTYSSLPIHIQILSFCFVGCVWGDRRVEKKLSLSLSCAQYMNLNHNIDLLSLFFFFFSGNRDQLFKIFHIVLWLIYRHWSRSNLTCTLAYMPHAYSYPHPHVHEHVTKIYFTATCICTHTRLDIFIHKLIRRVDLPAAIHHTVTHPRPGTLLTTELQERSPWDLVSWSRCYREDLLQ